MCDIRGDIRLNWRLEGHLYILPSRHLWTSYLFALPSSVCSSTMFTLDAQDQWEICSECTYLQTFRCISLKLHSERLESSFIEWSRSCTDPLNIGWYIYPFKDRQRYHFHVISVGFTFLSILLSLSSIYIIYRESINVVCSLDPFGGNGV